MKRSKGKHGGTLNAVGYTYVGVDDIEDVTNISVKNRETEVKLDFNRIPKELL